MSIATSEINLSQPRNSKSLLPTAILMPLALKRGGCEVMLINLLKANLIGSRIDYRICFLEDGPMVEEVRELGYPTFVIPVGRLRQAFRFISSIVKLSRWLREQRVELVLSWMEKAHLYGSPAALLAGIHSAWWLHSIDPHGHIIRLITALPAKHVFSDSQAAADVQVKRWPRRAITVCHCAVDIRSFSPERLPDPLKIREQLGLPVGQPIVSIIARLQRWKGVNVFIDAAAKVLASKSGLPPYFVIVGGEHALEPGVKTELEAQIQNLGIIPHVKVAGYQSNIPEWMQASDVIVHASTGMEPFGTVIVEAMALGKCVIASAAGGPLEIITDGVDGRLSAPGDANALANSVHASLLDSSQNRIMRSRAKERASYFSADRLSRDVEKAIRDMFLVEVPDSSGGFS